MHHGLPETRFGLAFDLHPDPYYKTTGVPQSLASSHQNLPTVAQFPSVLAAPGGRPRRVRHLPAKELATRKRRLLGRHSGPVSIAGRGSR